MFFISLYILTLYQPTTAQTDLKGSLIYEAHRQPSIVNPKIANFYRHVDLTHIKQSIEILEKFDKEYGQFCDLAIKKTRKPPHYFKHTVPSTFELANTECMRQGGELPEVRDQRDEEYLLKAMREFNLTVAWAGLIYDGVNHALKYMSDYSANRWAKFQHNRTAPVVTDLREIRTIVEMSRNRGELNMDLFYHRYQGSIYIIPESYIVLLRTKFKINTMQFICKEEEPKDNRILTTLAKHTCMRDRQIITETNSLLRDEYNQFYHTPNVVELVNRNKRDTFDAIKPIGQVLSGVETTIVVASGKAPLQWVGNLMSGLLGTATTDDVRLTRTVLQNHAQVLHNISFNQYELVKGYTAVVSKIIALEKYLHLHEHDAGVLFAELDNKIIIKNLQTLIQITLLKIAQAIEAAANNHPSPYVFGQADLNNITIRYRLDNTPLVTNIQKVHTSVVIVDNIYTFIVSIPEDNERNNFQFYTIADLPLFRDGQGYVSKYKYKWIGINTATNEYIAATHKEFLECTSQPICTTKSPIKKILELQSPCEISTFKTGYQKCPLEFEKGVEPAFVSYDNETYYSVPTPTNIHVTCNKDHRRYTEATVLRGTGRFHLPSGCDMQVGEDISIRPGFVFSKETLESDKIFHILQQSGKATLNLFPVLTNFTGKPLKPIYLREVTNIQDALDLIFSDETAGMLIIRILAIIALVIGALALLYCLFPKFRSWFNTCCLIVKPTKYWKNVREYDGLPEMISKKKRLQKEMEQTHTYVELDEKPIPPETTSTNVVKETEENKSLEEQIGEIEFPRTNENIYTNRTAYPNLNALYFPRYKHTTENILKE